MFGPALPAIIEQHADEPAILLRRRAALLEDDEADLALLRRLDGTIAGHLDGLRLAEGDGWELIVARFKADPAPETVAALAFLAVAGEAERRTPVLFDALAADPGLARGAALGLGWHGRRYAADSAKALMAADSLVERALAFELCWLAGLYPAAEIEAHLTAPPPLRARALELAGWANLAALAPRVAQPLDDDDAPCRIARAFATGLLADGLGAMLPLLEVAPREDGAGTLARGLLGMRLGREELGQLLSNLPDGPEAKALQLRIAGHLADPSLVPWLIDKAADPAMTPAAAESFRLLTGRRMEDALAEAPPPPLADPFTGGAPKPEAEPAPISGESAQLRAWWAKRSAKAERGAMVLGRAPSSEALEQLLATACLRDRPVILLRLRQAYGAVPAAAPEAPVGLF